MKNRRLSAASAFRLRPLFLALLALFAGPAAADFPITGERLEMTVSGDQVIPDHNQIGERRDNNDPQDVIGDTSLTFSASVLKSS